MTYPAQPHDATTLIDQGDRRILMAGDWHGDTRWALYTLREASRLGIRTVHSVGDFAFFRTKYHAGYLDAIEELAAELGITVFITDGNHEDHAWRLELEAEYGRRPAPIRPHLFLLPRGCRWTHAGRSFLSFGGAPSVNRESLTPGRDWWPEEVVTQHQVDRAVIGGYADVMISHDAPSPATGKVEHIRATNRMGLPLSALSYAAQGAYMLTAAYAGVQPRVLFHGHYHVRDTVERDGLRIESLAMNGMSGNAVVLDLGTLEIHSLRHSANAPKSTPLHEWEESYRAR